MTSLCCCINEQFRTGRQALARFRLKQLCAVLPYWQAYLGRSWPVWPVQLVNPVASKNDLDQAAGKDVWMATPDVAIAGVVITVVISGSGPCPSPPTPPVKVPSWLLQCQSRTGLSRPEHTIQSLALQLIQDKTLPGSSQREQGATGCGVTTKVLAKRMPKSYRIS